MTHYLRTKANNKHNTLVCIESLPKDIHSTVTISVFADELLRRAFDQKDFIKDIDDISEIRATYFEGPYSDSWETTDELAKFFCEDLAKKWDLYYVTD